MPQPRAASKAAAAEPGPSKAAAKRSQDTAPAAGATEHERQVFECGLLFVEEGRVAVSMLQKRFGMSFKQATAILDDLQQRGLIGPYLGGKKRDILLSKEEWLAQAAHPVD